LENNDNSTEQIKEKQNETKKIIKNYYFLTYINK